MQFMPIANSEKETHNGKNVRNGADLWICTIFLHLSQIAWKMEKICEMKRKVKILENVLIGQYDESTAMLDRRIVENSCIRRITRRIPNVIFDNSCKQQSNFCKALNKLLCNNIFNKEEHDGK